MKVTLHNNGTAYLSEEAYILCDEPLEIEVEADPKYDNLYAVCSTDNARLPYKIKDGKLTVPPSFMSPGVMRITFQHFVNGEAVKKWNTEKVTIKALDGKYEAIPELVVLRKAIVELYELVNKNKHI